MIPGKDGFLHTPFWKLCSWHMDSIRRTYLFFCICSSNLIKAPWHQKGLWQSQTPSLGPKYPLGTGQGSFQSCVCVKGPQPLLPDFLVPVSLEALPFRGSAWLRRLQPAGRWPRRRDWQGTRWEPIPPLQGSTSMGFVCLLQVVLDLPL